VKYFSKGDHERWEVMLGHDTSRAQRGWELRNFGESKSFLMIGNV